jgi:hypothetical protein
MVNKPRHTVVNLAHWAEARRAYDLAMADGRIDPREHEALVAVLEGGLDLGRVLASGEALEQATKRATDPRYLLDLAQVHAAYLERMPERAA